MGMVTGKACGDRCTKMLLQRINKNQIAVIKHRGLDLVAAQELKNKRVRAVINCERTIDGYRGIEAVKYLLKNSIGIYEARDEKLIDALSGMEDVCIYGNKLYLNGSYFAQCLPVTVPEALEEAMNIDEKKSFLLNTMSYMKDEMEYFLKEAQLPPIGVDIAGKEVLIVCRGRYYREDFNAVKSYIIHKKPVLIGVDGGANVIYESGLKCDIIVGDMDSVSDSSLLRCPNILVHTYMDGSAPGLKRVAQLGVDYRLLRLKGTSEDAAIYLCAIEGASTIYIIGSHMGIEEFMEKGRDGMGSTTLLRVIFGAKIVDLKGISRILTEKKSLYGMPAAVFFLLLLFTYIFFRFRAFEYIASGIKALLK